jgi:hypothetical protein
MNKKIVVIFIAGVLVGSAISFFWFKERIPKDFAFFEKLPEFTKEEISYIRDNYCKIYSNLGEPEKFYISHVAFGDSTIVDATFLGSLQDGSNSNQTVVSTSFDQTIQLIFDKNGRFISKTGHNP